MNKHNISILYVEDEENVRAMLSRFLKRFCQELYVAENGEVGLKLYKENKIDIVISDIRMPKMNGLEMTKAIKNINHEQLILLLTAHSDSQYLIDAINIDVDGYILKPIDLDIVSEKIEHFTHIIENQKAMKKLKMSEKKFRTLTEVSLTSIFIYQETFVYVNPAFCELTGYTEEELFALHPWDIVTKQYEEPIREIALKRINGEFQGSKLTQVEIKRKNGEIRTTKVSVATVPYHGRFAGTGNMLDITDMIRLEEELKQLATKDALTKIYNRYKINIKIEDEIKRADRYGDSFALIMFDIDHFKNVNDTYGHDAGDYVLHELSQLVLKSIRETDNFGRWGGEEFMLLLPRTSKDEIMSIAEKLRKEIEEHYFKYVNHITVSLGVTLYKRDEGITKLTKRVDIALYEAKTKGRNRVVFLKS